MRGAGTSSGFIGLTRGGRSCPREDLCPRKGRSGRISSVPAPSQGRDEGQLQTEHSAGVKLSLDLIPALWGIKTYPSMSVVQKGGETLFLSFWASIPSYLIPMQTGTRIPAACKLKSSTPRHFVPQPLKPKPGFFPCFSLMRLIKMQ